MRIKFATPATPVVGTISGTKLMEAGSHRYGLLVILGAYALCYAAIRTTDD